VPAPLSNTFEGGTDTAAITTGNSGGASGDAFNAVVGTCTYVSTPAMNGTLAAKFDHTAANAQSLVRWTGLGTITTDVYWRLYAQYTALPNNGNAGKMMIVFTAAAAVSGVFVVSTAGHVQILNAASASLGVGTGTVIPAGQRVRLEGHIISATSNGTMEMRSWNDPDSTGTPNDTVTSTVGVLGSDTDRVDIGLAAFGSLATIDFVFDDLAVSTAGWIGPDTTAERAFQVPSVYPPTKFGPF
jgi:hypothetical protein